MHALHDASWAVRKEALEQVCDVWTAAEQLEDPDNYHKVLTSVSILVRDANASLRAQAMRAMKRLTRRGNKRGIDAVLLGLQDRDSSVRFAALEILDAVLSPSQIETLSRPGGLLEDIRSLSLSVLGHCRNVGYRSHAATPCVHCFASCVAAPPRL